MAAKQKKGMEYFNASIVLLAVFFLAIPFIVTFAVIWQFIYIWYVLPFASLIISVLLRKHDKELSIHQILFSIIGIIMVLMFATVAFSLGL